MPKKKGTRDDCLAAIEYSSVLGSLETQVHGRKMDENVLPSSIIMVQLCNATGMPHTSENVDFFAPFIQRTRCALDDAYRLLACELASSHDSTEDPSLVAGARSEIVTALLAFVPSILTSDWLDVSPCLVTHHAVMHVKREMAEFRDYDTEHYQEKARKASEIRQALNERIDSVNPDRTLPEMEKKIVCPGCKSPHFVRLTTVQIARADEPAKRIYTCGNKKFHGMEVPFDDVSSMLG